MERALPMSIWRFAVVLATAFILVATSGAVPAKGVIIIENASIDVRPELGLGRVAACGITFKAPYTLDDRTVRTWDVTVYMDGAGKTAGFAVNASSYDVAAARTQMRPALMDLAFSVKGNTEVFTATNIRASQGEQVSLAVLAD